jgi:RNA polymerase sigma factor (sigma-70 family)
LSLTRDQYVKQVLAINRTSMRAWLWLVTHDYQSLEDLRQDTYERLLAVDDKVFPAIRSVEAYARGVCRNVAMSWLRARRNRRIVDSVGTCDVFADERQSPEAIARARERLDRVRKALEELPERRRLVLVLRRIYGFTAKEIAMRMEIKVPTVKRLLHDGTTSLEELLNEEDAGASPLLQQLLDAKE